MVCDVVALPIAELSIGPCVRIGVTVILGSSWQWHSRELSYLAFGKKFWVTVKAEESSRMERGVRGVCWSYVND